MSDFFFIFFYVSRSKTNVTFDERISAVCLTIASRVYMCVLSIVQRCELCPQREGALKRTDNGSE